MIVLGIDPGTSCGWALRHPSGAVDSGVWMLRPLRHEGGGMRFLRLRCYLRELLDKAKPDVVVYEEVRRHMGVDAAHIYGGIVAVISEECEARKIPYRGVPVASIKKTATGKGNADKPAMLRAGEARWPGYCFLDDNEADARFCAETAAAELFA